MIVVIIIVNGNGCGDKEIGTEENINENGVKQSVELKFDNCQVVINNSQKFLLLGSRSENVYSFTDENFLSTHLNINQDDNFEYMLLAYKTCIAGIRYMWKVISPI